METVSAKVPEELKRALEEEDINVSEAVREALEAEVERRRRERLAAEAEALAGEIGDRVDVDEVVAEVVDEIRDAREER